MGNAAYPCDANDSLEWVALGGTAAREAGLPYGIFQPGDVAVHVPDTPGLGRYFDSNDMLVWSTGYRHVIGNEVAFFREGVMVSDNFKLLDDAVWGVSPPCPPGAPPPVCASIAQQREVNFRATISGLDTRTSKRRRAGGHNDEESVEYTLYDFDSATGIHDDSRIIGSGIPGYYEFGALGTYTVEVTATGKHNNSTPDDDTDDTDYTTTAATYTFHVGPVADLEVGGLEESSLATAEQMAYTIEAVNQGPDDAEGAKVKVDVTLPEGVSVGSSVASAGTYDKVNDVWNIGPLQRADHRSAAGLPEGETLTLIVTCVPTCEGVTLEDATATISHDNDAHPYTVCIGSDGYDVLPKPANSADCTGTSGNTWHSGDVYDYDTTTTSDKATLKARAGTADVPTELIPETMTTGVVPGGSAETPEVDPDTGETHPVQVEVKVPAASTVATDDVVITVSEISGYDGDSTAFVFDVTTMHTGTEADPLVLRFHITTDAAREDMDVYYTDDEGNLLRVPDCVGGALGAGEERCVSERQRVNDVVTVTVLTTSASEWRVVVRPIEAETIVVTRTRTRTVTETPVYPEDLLATPSGETEILLSWSALDEFNGSPVAHYRVEVSGADGSGWSTLVDNHAPTSYAHTGLTSGDTRHYRVYAVNGNGEESHPSGTASATTGTTVTESPVSPAGLRATPNGETGIDLSWSVLDEFNGSPVAHYRVEVSGADGSGWSTLVDEHTPTSYAHTGLTSGDTRHYRVYAVNGNGEESDPSGTASATTGTTKVETETVYESEDDYAYFADEETTRTVAENSAPGSPVGAPVTVIRNSGNKVVYSLEGPDMALFAIEQDTGQILVGEGALLDYESGTASYTVEVVADPSSGADVKTTVTITVTDVAETGFVFIDPAGTPMVGAPLFAGLLHTEGEPVEPRWQWQRSMPDGSWADIPGAILEIYTPSDLDAGRRLRALVVFGNPLGDGEGLEGAVTERVPGEAQVIPTAGTGAAPEEVFGVLGHSLAVVWQFDNATQTWAVYSPWNAPELNDLKTVSRGDVVWMDIISEAQFQGNTLYPGWNLVILN